MSWIGAEGDQRIEKMGKFPADSAGTITRELVHRGNAESVFLDSRLALHAESGRWMALGDLHYGYEVTRRVKGSLWPLWGSREIDTRVNELLDEYRPELVILNGDIIDSSAAGSRGACDWLRSLERKCDELVLVKGNHDRGGIVDQFSFVPHFRIGEFLFHHGHLPVESTDRSAIEVIGHFHPSVRFRDGAGLSIKLPALVQEPRRWIMPAFSPWAAGGTFASDAAVTRWACSPRRIIRVTDGAEAPGGQG